MWFTVEDGLTYLVGTQCTACRTVCFPPKTGFCPNPRCDGEQLTETRLSRSGRVWSYTNSCYPPPEPFEAAEPYVPITIAAVELDREKIVVLGRVKDLTVADLSVGMELELTSEDGVWLWTR
ncbi:Zn-ribbon domain-containing OB-fold protein [Nonomuraea sp. NPDC050663]|uniref:Zn-ribbon domain-containing OB-fold protein n=1 Tax=Nonomuraea sp. NPDC050663 TaxID=3364370 RepID=UPI0037B7999E